MSWTSVLVIGSTVAACSSPVDPGQVRFRVHATPPPDDALLSPLTDPRASSIELRDGRSNALVGSSRFDALKSGDVPSLDLDLGDFRLGAARPAHAGAGDGRAAGAGPGAFAQCVVGYGKETEVVLELRRPLVFFGGSGKADRAGGAADGHLCPQPADLRAAARRVEAARHRPNAANPLISQYDLQFDKSGGLSSPVIAAAGTFDGQSLLVASQAGKLHVVDTLKLEDRGSIDLDPSLPAQSIVD